MSNKNNFIPCAKWIKRGIAKSTPEMVELSKEELQGLVAKAKSNILTTAESMKTVDGDQIDMEDYDKEEDIKSLVDIGNLISLDDDLENLGNEDEMDEDDSDKEDDEIKPTDNLIAVGHVSGDLSVLEVYVYNEQDDDLYIHHDVVLPTIPLALEWLSSVQGHDGKENLLAMGGMDPVITIWDLDVMNSLEPLLKLGKFSNKKKHQHRNHGHRDAVLDLSWNKKLPHVLASGSVDRSVLLWDLDKARALSQFTDFNEKVQTIEWHSTEVNLLLVGTCDSTVRLLDCRIIDTLNSFKVKGEVEKVVWHPSDQFCALIGTSKGYLCCADCRTDKLIWKVKAHDKELTGLVSHDEKPDSVVTCSTDGTVKLWDLSEARPQLVYTKYTNMGELQCLQVCPENPNIVCIGSNSKSNNFRVYDLSCEMQKETDSQEMETGSQDD